MNDIYISDINLKNSVKKFFRTTRNYYYYFVDGYKLVFSYKTLIAIDKLVSVNNWSRTTGRHLYWYSGIAKDHPRVDDFNERARKILKKAGLLKDERNPLKTVSAISSIFALMSNEDNEEQIRKTNNQRKRFYETQPGITFPDDWESLSTADQKKRLDMCDYVGLDKSNEILNSSTSRTI